jgi:hypothetical protein
MEELLPAKAIFMDGKVPGPLTEEERRWLVKQLAAYPKRVNEARTCCIGALKDMATTEFCRLMADRTQLDELRTALERIAQPVFVAEPAGKPDSAWFVALDERIKIARKALGGTNG